MTELTEKLRAGELYYVKKKNGEIVIRQAHLYSCLRTENAMPFVDFEDNDVEKVIAPVPSYDEWQASENYIDYLKQCISVYESKNKQATETSIAYNELLEENTKLKELLKECRPALVRFVSYDDSDENARILLMNKINEVLK